MARKPPARPSLDIARRQPAPVAAPLTADGNRLVGAREVPIDQVIPDPDQPRRDWDAEEADGGLDELAASLKEFGVLQPLLVREDGSLDDGRARYVVIAGGRRRAAAERAGFATLPVVIRDEEAGRVRAVQLVENIQRRALAPLDEARAYQEIIDAEGISAEALGTRLGISGQQVRDRILLLSDQVVSDAVQRAQVPATVASELLRLPAEGQHLLRGRIEAGEALERSDVRETREALAAAGVKNPRAKGGGRATRATQKDQSSFDPQRVQKDQSSFDPAGDKAHSGEGLPEASPLALRVYSAFQAWQADLDRVLPQLPPKEARGLRGLLRADMERLLGFLAEDWDV